jgi:SAM-dependent methyltransferase
MREALLDILVEPVTHAPLELSVERHEGDVIVLGKLTSTQTGKTYPIRNGIPRFVPDSGYADGFGKQWNMFRTVQLDSTNGATYSEKRFDHETRWTAADLDDRLVLDAGCGAGRFAEIAAARGGRVVALDMSSAVDAVRETLSRFPRCEVVQASLLEPPFANVFDFAYSLGVLQHTPDPQGGVRSVVSCLKDGGQFAFAIYARRPWTKLHAKYLVRPLTKRLSSEVLLRGIEAAMPVVFPVADKVFRLPVVGRVAQFVSPFAVYVDEKGFTDEQRYHEAVLDTFDMLAPAYDSPMTWREVEGALRQVSAAHWSFTSRVPVVAVGRR